jgi:hypothetical protein
VPVDHGDARSTRSAICSGVPRPADGWAAAGAASAAVRAAAAAAARRVAEGRLGITRGEGIGARRRAPGR